jgi:phosphohistidine swiveling domain-containing protein
MDNPPVAGFEFETKARTLEALKPQLTRARVLALFYFSYAEWNTAKRDIAYLENVPSWVHDTRVIVRSSAADEDLENGSRAGAYKSLAVDGSSAKRNNTIASVFASYGDAPSDNDEVLIQPYLESALFFGVTLSCDLDTEAPYYIINLDRAGGSDSITGGQTRGESWLVFRDDIVDIADPHISQIVSACREIEAVTKNNRLDIEFAVEENGIAILQVRPITIQPAGLGQINMVQALDNLAHKIKRKQEPFPGIVGGRSIFGVMPDWNPAEVIGTRPCPLAFSLYRELITDEVWAEQRRNYGYRDLSGHPLLISFHGVPYVDARLSFNSFIPAALDDTLAAKLANHYLERLATLPELHDKVEFDIVISCIDLDFPDQLERLSAVGLTASEITDFEQALRNITNRILSPSGSHLVTDISAVATLEQRLAELDNLDLPSLDRIYWLVEICKKYGTLPFAGIARCAFVAVQIMNSLVTHDLMSGDEREQFYGSVRTVTSKLASAVNDVSMGDMTREAFLDAFGHLRPGTYDPRSPRYDEAFEKYFPDPLPQQPPARKVEFALPPDRLKAIDTALADAGLSCTASELFGFIRSAIEAREDAKFKFTRAVSDLLRELQNFFRRIGLDAEDVAFIDIKSILSLYNNFDDRNFADYLHPFVESNRALFDMSRKIRLPSIIDQPQDIYVFQADEAMPNFVTLKSVTGRIVLEQSLNDMALEGAIVLTESADPGYDFLFATGIHGLVTKHGGVNSHMAIRCAELGIPAVIGAGEANYSNWCRANVLSLRCAERLVQIIS